MKAQATLTDIVIWLPALVSWMNNNLLKTQFEGGSLECVAATVIVETIRPFEFGYFMQA